MKDPRSLWFDISHRFAEQSRCKTRQVGCIIVRDGHLIGEGWNGAPEGSSCEHCPRCRGGAVPTGAALDRAICTHAEANAIGYCSRRGVATQGADMYLTTSPCMECAKLIVASGIKNVYCFSLYAGFDEVRGILERANIGLFGPNFQTEQKAE